MEDHAVDISCAVHELDVHLSADQTGQELLLEDPVHVALTLEKLLSGLCLKGKIRNTALKTTRTLLSPLENIIIQHIYQKLYY